MVTMMTIKFLIHHNIAYLKENEKNNNTFDIIAIVDKFSC